MEFRNRKQQELERLRAQNKMAKENRDIKREKVWKIIG